MVIRERALPCALMAAYDAGAPVVSVQGDGPGLGADAGSPDRSALRHEPAGAGVRMMAMGSGVAAVQRDGAAGCRSPPAPYGSEPGGGQPGNDDDGHEVDDAEDRDVTVTRQQQRPAHRNDVSGGDQETVMQPDAVGEVVGGEPGRDGTADSSR